MADGITDHIGRTIYSDKKQAKVDPDLIRKHLIQASNLHRDMDVGQREATITITPEYEHTPLFIWFLCDSHIGNVFVDYPRFFADYDTVKKTPHFAMVGNGDEVDHFCIDMGKASQGVYEAAINPEQQARFLRELLKTLDEAGKLLSFSFGNHNEWSKKVGYKFENTWLADFDAPILNCGGVLTIKYGKQTYRLAMSHSYWGNSKKNPTNALKNFRDFEYPDADAYFLGHTHKCESLFFRRDQNKDYQLGVIGGTYKVDEEFGPQVGNGHPHQGGMVWAIWPDRFHHEMIESVEEAKHRYQLYQALSEQGGLSK